MRISDWSSDVCSSDLTSRQMDIDDRIHLIGATQRLVDALAEQCDRARRGGEQVKEALEIGRGQIARVRHALQIVTNVDPFQKTFRNSTAPVQKAFIDPKITRLNSSQ